MFSSPRALAPIVWVLAAGAPALATTNAPDLARALGLTPATLAASGFTLAMSQQVLTALDSSSSERSQLQSSEASLDSLLTQIGALNAQIDEIPDPDLMTQRDGLVAQVPNAESAVVSARQALLAYAVQGASSEYRACAARVIANAGVAVPLEFKVMELSAEAAGQLAVAVTAEAVSDRGQSSSHGEFDADAFLSSYRARADVTAARTSLSANLAALADLFATWGQ